MTLVSKATQPQCKPSTLKPWCKRWSNAAVSVVLSGLTFSCRDAAPVNDGNPSTEAHSSDAASSDAADASVSPHPTDGTNSGLDPQDPSVNPAPSTTEKDGASSPGPSNTTPTEVATSTTHGASDTASQMETGDESSAGPIEVVLPTTAAEFWTAWATVACAYGDRCNGYPADAGCVDYVRRRAQNLARFSSPSLTLNLEAGYACLQAYAGPSCPADSDLYNEGLGEVCQRFLVGNQAEGGACQEDVECGPNAFCNLFDSCPGQCQAAALLGEDCTNNLCAFGLSCNGVECVRDLPVGSPCEESGQVPRCEINAACRNGECVGVRSNVLEPGATCWREDECKGGARCVDGVCEPSGTLDQPCNAGYCAPGLFCDAVTNSCIPEKAPGDACTQETECSRSECSDGYCKPRVGLGETCGIDVDCYSFNCVEHRCEFGPRCED